MSEALVTKPLGGGASLHDQVLSKMGAAICNAEIPVGATLRIEELEAKYEVSRSVVREVVRVLESMGLVSSKRRVGVQVLPTSEWNLYDPRVIRWRLEGPDRALHLRSLTELRMAVEPEAARLAALRAPLALASDLVGLSGRLWAAGKSGDQALFLELDAAFHHLVLLCSGNEMFTQLDIIVAESLSGRTRHGLMPTYPHDDALKDHMDVAHCIQRGDGDGARRAMRGITERTLDEMSPCFV